MPALNWYLPATVAVNRKLVVASNSLNTSQLFAFNWIFAGTAVNIDWVEVFLKTRAVDNVGNAKFPPIIEALTVPPNTGEVNSADTVEEVAYVPLIVEEVAYVAVRTELSTFELFKLSKLPLMVVREFESMSLDKIDVMLMMV